MTENKKVMQYIVSFLSGNKPKVVPFFDRKKAIEFYLRLQDDKKNPSMSERELELGLDLHL